MPRAWQTVFVGFWMKVDVEHSMVPRASIENEEALTYLMTRVFAHNLNGTCGQSGWASPVRTRLLTTNHALRTKGQHYNQPNKAEFKSLIFGIQSGQARPALRKIGLRDTRGWDKYGSTARTGCC